MAKSKVQVKFTLNSDIASAFKAKCVDEGVSMASVISQWMEIGCPTKKPGIQIDTRPRRKKAVVEFVGLLENLLQKEEDYRDAIPEQFVSRVEAADMTCGQLEEAISCLMEAYP